MTTTAAETQSSADLERIRAIENGLLPAFVVDGLSTPPRTLVQEMRASNTPAVSIAFFSGGRVRWAKAYGRADIESGRLATVNTLFQACSISKPVAALGALILVEQGKLALDADVNQRLASWRIPDSVYTAETKVTLRRLLNHTAGLTVHGLEGYTPGAVFPTIVQTLNGSPPANNAPVVSMAAPGASWAYSGGGYTVAQLCMTEVCGEPFPALMRRLVFDPAKMGRSTYEQPLPKALVTEAATGYLWDESPVPGKFNIYPTAMAAGGLWTTPSDLARFAIAVQDAALAAGHNLVHQSTAREMLTPALNNWGLGPEVNPPGLRPGFSHGGDNLGFKAKLVAYTTGRREGAVVMTNGEGGRHLVPKIMRAIAAAYGLPGGRPEVKRCVELSLGALQAFAGTYRQSNGAEFSIAAKTDGLYLSKPEMLGPQPILLVPEGACRFFASSTELTLDFDLENGEPTGRLRLGWLSYVFDAERV